MPRPRPPGLHRQVSRHGKIVWYVRPKRGRRIRIRGEFGTPEFKARYEAAARGEDPEASRTIKENSLQWLWDSYRKTNAWLHLAPATRRQRENIMLHVLALSGTAPFAKIRKTDIVAGLDRRAATPSAARNFLDTMRGMFQWALEREHVATDPTAAVKPPKRRKGSGFKPWTIEDVRAYQARWPLGTPQRVWLDVLLYTGLRRGDAAMIGPEHVSNGVVAIATEKSGHTVLVTLPILKVLQTTLDAGPTGATTWICGEKRKPFTKESFGNLFSAAARAAGVKKSAHGVRKIAATVAAENGATEKELEAIFGWTGGRMAALYTRDANRARLAAQAVGKLESIPSPMDKVRELGDIIKSFQPLNSELVGEAEVKSPNNSNDMQKGEG
jgi:integrase